MRTKLSYNGKEKRTVTLNPITNVGTIYTAPRYQNFHAICSEINIQDDEEEINFPQEKVIMENIKYYPSVDLNNIKNKLLEESPITTKIEI